MASRQVSRWEAILNWLEKAGSVWSFLSGLGVLSVGGLTAWAAKAANLLADYAPFSWVVTGILASGLVGLIMLSVATARLKWANVSAANKWKEAVATVNPLEKDFRNQRILMSDLVSPITRKIKGKTFVDCELIGPLGLIIRATRPGSAGFNGTTFDCCDWILAAEGVPVFNAILLEDCHVIGGTVHRVSIYMSSTEAKAMGLPSDLLWVTGPVPNSDPVPGPPTPSSVAA